MVEIIINGEKLNIDSFIAQGQLLIAEGSIAMDNINFGAYESVEEVGIEANNCTNLTISSTSTDSEPNHDSIKVESLRITATM